MIKHRERPPLHLKPGTSRRLAGFLFLTHTAAAAVVLLLPLTWYLRTVLLVAVGAGLAYQIWAHLLNSLPWSVCEAVWEPDGIWQLTLASGRRVEARLSPDTFVSTALVLLNFRCGRWRPCFLILPADSLDPELMRRLRARLRIAGNAASKASDTAG